jgi:hypothetical protein
LQQHAEKMLLPLVKVFYHADRLHYLPPEEIDLAKPSCKERITSHESFEKWGIDPAKWLPA